MAALGIYGNLHTYHRPIAVVTETQQYTFWKPCLDYKRRPTYSREFNHKINRLISINYELRDSSV